jgi:geranylgeranyl diphosphate synthase type I
MTTAWTIAERFAEELRAIEHDLQQAVSPLKQSDYYADIWRHVAYHFGWDSSEAASAGKRIRPLLTVLCAQGAGGDWRLALPAASGLELIHNFSLIHDDIEDRSDTRRGRATLWKAWTMPQALNTGDALLVLSHLACHRLNERGLPPALALEVQQMIDRSCLQVTLGQHLDLDFETREGVTENDYLEMISGKTAALIAAACGSGAMVGGAASAVVQDYYHFGEHMGIAFQILDDILGIWGSPAVTGKPAGDDLATHKKTFPVVFGLSHCEGFHKLWSQPDPSNVDISSMAELLESCGALEHAQQAAATHTQQSLRHLQAAGPHPPASDSLADLAQHLLTRSR